MTGELRSIFTSRRFSSCGKKKSTLKNKIALPSPTLHLYIMAKPFHALSLEAILDKDTNKNKADLLCPKDGCQCVILRKNTAVLIERDGSKLSLPETSLPVGSSVDQENDKDETHFWCLSDMMDFDNVGFSKTIGTIKYLSCADCDIGPIGYHDTADSPKEYLVSIKRARYRF
ncbi:Mss4-like protein, partial [Chlamydoabsidia padenii]